MRRVFSLWVMLCISTKLLAQQDVTADDDPVRAMFGKDKTTLMNGYLQISLMEEKSFLDVMSEYESEKAPLLAERLALLSMYNQEYTSVDEKKMNTLTKQLISNDLEFSRLQMRYFRRMNRLLGANRAARFFQLDNYFEQASRVYIQYKLPFISELESEKRGQIRNKTVTMR
ncbi:hypothetical protein ACDQ55_20345 [Chitinophaga sp. 30R24]|uniref:hypothetical protein n=1 Tax=Chitinophaga sp. 30R24 TaxID=3248838 RepID=UPI003B90D919